MNHYVMKTYPSGNQCRIYPSICSICGCDRGYLPRRRTVGQCSSCASKIASKTLDIEKKCIKCGTTSVPDPSKNWYAGPTCFNCYSKQYKQDNIEAERTRSRSYSKNKYHNNIQHKLKANLRNRLNQKVRFNKKAGSAVRDLGCTIEELKKHLEDQFVEGMSWDNYGEWHIDHIRPLCSFDLTDRMQFKEACHYTNLRPLWAKDNLMKSKDDRRNIRK